MDTWEEYQGGYMDTWEGLRRLFSPEKRVSGGLFRLKRGIRRQICMEEGYPEASLHERRVSELSCMKRVSELFRMKEVQRGVRREVQRGVRREVYGVV